ncbi:MAG: RNA-binding domain-containing protein [Patescibacteria group bacterium]
MTKQAITKLTKQPESETFEKKPSLSDIGRMVEIVSSFANHKGGQILVGVGDKGKIIGVDIGKNTIERLTDTIIDKTEPKIYPEILTLKIEDKNLVLISVKSSSQKPHTAGGRPFKRVGKNTKAMSQSEYESLLMEKNRHKMKFDIEICEEAALEDIGTRKISWYLKEREKARNISRKINMSTKELLTNLKCLVDGKPTNAGILFFGKYPQRFMPNARLRVVKFKGNDVINPTLDSATCEGTLPEMIDLAEDFIRKNIRLLGTRTEKSFRREDKFEYPIKAVREAVINAMIHRNYFESGDVRVFIFDNRIEITNPGTFPKGVTPQHPEHKPVNEILCQLIFDIGQIEKYGSGIKMMRSLSKEWGNKEPYYKLSPISSTIIFESQIKESSYIEVSGFKGLNERQKKGIECLKEKGKMTRKDYEKVNKTTKRTSVRDLNELLKNNIIKTIGKGPAQYYTLK